MPLESLGKYERLDVLGHGASGIVYLAKDTLLGKQVALKEISAQGDEKERFLEEARVLDRLRHPNIVQVNSVDEIGGRVVIDMEYVRGRNLQEVLRQTPQLPIPEAVAITAQICDGLAYAHSRRTVHRDIKPANILLTQGGVVKLVDFGLAEVLGTHSFAGGAGTYAYMAQEDFHPDERSDRQSDIWAVGVILYEMLTGRRPFQVAKAKDPFAWKTAVESDPIVPISALRPDVPASLEAIAFHALARDKRDRYADAGQMAADLRALGLDTDTSGISISSAGLFLNESRSATEEPNAVGIESRSGFVHFNSPALPVPGSGVRLLGFPGSVTEIDTFLSLAPDEWDAARNVLVNGTLPLWLRSIGEEPLARVADEVAAEPGRDADEKLRDFLYRAGVETAEEARHAHAEAERLAASGQAVEAATLQRRAARLDPARPEYHRSLAAAEETREKETRESIALSRDTVDFGTLRRGQSRTAKITLRPVSGGKLEGRVSAAPGWLRVEPPSFSSKKQTLTLTTDTDTVWSAPAVYSDTVTLETSAGRRDITVSAQILPARLSWDRILLWYAPLLACAAAPVAASLAGRVSHPPVHGIQQPGFAAGGLLFLSVFVLTLVADIAWPPRLLPLALSGVVLWRLSLMYGLGTNRTHFLLVQTVAPIIVLLVLQACAFFLAPSGWGNWKIWRWIIAAVGLLTGYGLLHAG